MASSVTPQVWSDCGKREEKTDECIDRLIALSHASIGVCADPASASTTTRRSARGHSGDGGEDDDGEVDHFYGFSREKTIWGKKSKKAIAPSDFTLSATKEGQ